MAKDIDKGQMRSGETIPGPDVMLGMWASWMDQMAATGQGSAGQGKPWWQITTAAPAPDALPGGGRGSEGAGGRAAARIGPGERPDTPLHSSDVECESPA